MLPCMQPVAYMVALYTGIVKTKTRDFPFLQYVRPVLRTDGKWGSVRSSVVLNGESKTYG